MVVRGGMQLRASGHGISWFGQQKGGISNENVALEMRGVIQVVHALYTDRDRIF